MFYILIISYKRTFGIVNFNALDRLIFNIKIHFPFRSKFLCNEATFAF